jgi:hypothetical protein
MSPVIQEDVPYPRHFVRGQQRPDGTRSRLAVDRYQVAAIE